MKHDLLLDEVAKLLEIDRSDLNMDTLLTGYGNWDSLVVISMIASIDEHCGILLKWHEIEQCQTLNDLFRLIECKNKKTNPS